MVNDGEILGSLNLSSVKNVLNRDLPLVILHKLLKGRSSLKPHESASEVVDDRSKLLVGQSTRDETVIQPLPRTTARVLLVRLKVAAVLKMRTILIDEVPNNAVNVRLGPRKPIFNGRSEVKDSPAVKFGGIHLAHLILSTMLATVHRTDDNGIGVERNASNLAAIGQFEDALSNLKSPTVNLVKKDETGLSASGQKPIGSVPSRCTLAANLNDVRSGKAKQVTLSHLRATTLNDGKAHASGNLVDNLALADAVTATNEDGKAHAQNVRSDASEGSEIDSHDENPWKDVALLREPFPPALST
jgi:hypothetical protein